MVYVKSQVDELLNGVTGVEDLEVVKVHEKYLEKQEVTTDEDLKNIADSLITIGKGVVSKTLVHASDYGLYIKSPSVRAYTSLSEGSDIPHIKLTISGTPSYEFSFKETLDKSHDENFRDHFISFLESAVYSLVSTAIAHANVQALNELLNSIKTDIIDEELEVAFDLSFNLSDKTIDYISNDKLVLGTTQEQMHDLVSSNSMLESLFNEDEETSYISDAIKNIIIEDWVTSPNPLVFIRKHNKYILSLVTGEPNTRRTKRVDVLIRNSFTLSADSLKHRKSAIAHKLDKDGDESYISVYQKESKEGEVVEILSPVNVKSLAYKG